MNVTHVSSSHRRPPLPAWRLFLPNGAALFSRGVALLLASGAVLPAVAQDYIVQANGAGGAFTSVQAAITAAVNAGPSGKIIEIRANTPGTTQVFAQTINMSSVNIASTSEANWLTIRVRAGDTIRFRTTGSLLFASGTSRGWKIEGNSSGYTSLQFGDLADYQHANYKTCYPQTHGAEIASTCSNYAIRRALFTGASGSGSYTANIFDGSDYELDTVAVFDHGTNSLDPESDWGDAARVSGVRVKMRNLLARHGGHNTFIFMCRDSVLREGDFSGYWGDISAYSGTRSMNSVQVSGSSPYGPFLMEGNIIRDAGNSADNSTQAAMKNEGNRLIIRDNFYFDTDSHLWNLAFSNATAASTSYFSGQSLYHNTSYISKGTWWDAFNNYNTASGNAQFENNLIANNLFQALDDNDKTPVTGGQILLYDTHSVSLNGYPNAFHGTVIKGNIVHGPSQNYNVQLRGPAGNVTFPITNSAQFPANVFSNSVSQVAFSDVGTPRNRTKAGFAVTNWGGGASAGDALELTTISANSSGTTITVANARPFYDGWGIRGEVGDYLYIGSTAAAAESAGPVQISSINYTNNTIVLTASRSVTSGQGVWFGGNAANGAASIRKNRGAFVSSSGSVPSAPNSLTATTDATNPTSAINLSWQNVANETGYSIERKTGAGGTYAEVDTTAANVNTLLNSGLTADTQYYYKVRSYNGTGYSTSYSPEATATTDPAGGSPVTHEAESLTETHSSGDTVTTITPSGVSGSAKLLTGSAVGDWVEFTANVATAGTHNVKVGFHRNAFRAIAKLLVDGNQLGSPYDAHNATADVVEIDFGNVSLSTGNHAFRFEVTGRNDGSSNTTNYQVAVDYITLTPVGTNSVPIITTTTLPGTIAGESYSQALAATGGDGTLVWTVDSGSLPAGLSLSSAGVISGNATTPGTANFTVKVADSDGVTGTSDEDTQALSIVVTANSVPSITTTTLPGTITGESYSDTLAATGGNGSLTWSLASGALPDGLSLSSGGVISGSATTAGTANFTVKVADSDGVTGAGDEDTQALNSRAPGTTEQCNTTTTLPGTISGESYSETLAATGGNGSLTWSLASGSLPAGLSLSSAGVISGSATTAGTANFTVKVVDSDGITGAGDEDTQALSIAVTANSAPSITTATLPAGTVGAGYSQSLAATGGNGSLTWSLDTGSLPTGLSLSSGGVISGTPSATGTFNFTVRVADSDGNTGGSDEDTQALSIVINSPATVGFRAAASANSGGSATGGLTITKPTGVVSGDYLIAAISLGGAGPVTAPSGWTLVSGSELADGVTLAVFTKPAGGSEPANYTFSVGTNRKMAGGIAAFTGVQTATPIQVQNGAVEGTTAVTNHTTPTISVSGSSAWLVAIFADRNATGSTWTASGTTERVDTRSTGTNAASVAIYSTGPVSAGSKSQTAIASVSSDEAAMRIIAIQP